MSKFLSLDIETYGILKGREQRYFHPKKSEAYDGVPAGQQVITCSLSWYVGPDTVKSGIFVLDRPSHRTKLWKWLAKAKSEGWTLLGQNVTFDLMYLRFNYPEARFLLQPPLRLMDLLIINYLHDESRPERSLKDLAPLLGVTKYKDGFRRYKNSNDPELWAYNCQDTEATLRSYVKLEEAIRGTYGADTQKLSPFCMNWYSELLWLVLWMSEDGVSMDLPALQTIHDRYLHRIEKLTGIATVYGLVLSGEGSEKSKRGVMQSALDFIEQYNDRGFSDWGQHLGGLRAPEPLIKTPQMKLTSKTGKIAFKDENRNALLEVLPRHCTSAKHLRLLSRVQDTNGMLDKYCRPLVFGRMRKGQMDFSPCILGGQLFPTWFPVPGEFDDGSRGGTKQSRIVAKNPPLQTFPPLVKKRITCRFPGGCLLWFDYSQIELRIAALLSNDTPMMTAYLGKPDLHTDTGLLLMKALGQPLPDDPKSIKDSPWRMAGKILNFLTLYRGGAKKFQETVMREVGLRLTLEQCQVIIDSFWAAHPELRAWQDALVAEAAIKGFVELPLIGQSRLFIGGKRVANENVNDIVNLPVQVMAANVMLSAQFTLYKTIKERNMRSRVPLNIYDAAAIEVAPLELEPIQGIMREVLPNPPFFVALCKHLGRSIPLTYDAKVLT